MLIAKKRLDTRGPHISGCKTHPATAPAGSNRSSHGGNPSSSDAHRPSFGRGCTSRSYSNDVSPDLSTFRTVFRDTFRSRAISLIVLPLMKCSRRIRAIVSTTSIPNHPLHSKAGSATDLSIGGQFWGLTQI